MPECGGCCWGGGQRGILNLSLLPSPSSTSTTQLPSKPVPKPGAVCGTSGRMCCDGQRGAEPPAHLDCRPSTVRGRCLQPSGFYSCTAEYLMPGAAPRRGCPLFYFFNQKIGRIKEEQGRWWHAAMCLLCDWGSMWHSGRGSHPGFCSPFQCQAHVHPPQSCTGTMVVWHSPKGG